MTTRFCAQCGTLLEATAWYGGVCPGCGAKVDVTRGVVGPEGADSAEVATRLSAADSDTDVHALVTPGMPADGAATTPAQQPPTAAIPVAASAPPDASRSRRAPSPWTLILISTVIIALVGVLAYSLAPRGVVSIILAPFAAAGANASSNSSSSSSANNPSGAGTPSTTGKSGGNGAPANPTNTPNAGATAASTTSATPVGIGTAPPGSTVVPTVSATAGPTPVGSPAPGVLSVSPTNVTAPTLDCLSAKGATATPSITVANTGGQPLTWSVSDNGNGYTFSTPGGTTSGGTLNPGQSVQVTVSHVTGIGGKVTFSAHDAQNSPQTANVTCI